MSKGHQKLRLYWEILTGPIKKVHTINKNQTAIKLNVIPTDVGINQNQL